MAKPGRDPREKFSNFEFAAGINKIEDLHPGMKLSGIVTNVTAFGAFVDIGVHQDGLVHVSQMSDRFIKAPHEILKVHQKVTVTVLDVDVARCRISLSMKAYGKDKSKDESHKIEKRSGIKIKKVKQENRKKGPFNNPFAKLKENK